MTLHRNACGFSRRADAGHSFSAGGGRRRQPGELCDSGATPHRGGRLAAACGARGRSDLARAVPRGGARFGGRGRRGDHHELRLPGRVPGGAAGRAAGAGVDFEPAQAAGAGGARCDHRRCAVAGRAPPARRRRRCHGAGGGSGHRLPPATRLARRRDRPSTPAAPKPTWSTPHSDWWRAGRWCARSCSNAPTCRPMRRPWRAPRGVRSTTSSACCTNGGGPWKQAHERLPTLAVLDRSRRHLHRRRRPRARPLAAHAEAAVGQPRAVPRRGGRRHPPSARPAAPASRSRPRRWTA